MKRERLKFDSIGPYAGEWIHGQGYYIKHPHPGPPPEGEGVARRAAICIGPEHGAVGAALYETLTISATRR